MEATGDLVWILNEWLEDVGNDGTINFGDLTAEHTTLADLVRRAKKERER